MVLHAPEISATLFSFVRNKQVAFAQIFLLHDSKVVVPLTGLQVNDIVVLVLQSLVGNLGLLGKTDGGVLIVGDID